MQIEIITNHKCVLGEGPVWDAVRNEIYWIDIVKGEIHQYDFKTENHNIYPINEMIGSFAICKNGQFVIATQSGFGFFDRVTREKKMSIDPENHLPNNRFNEGKCDPDGRFWAGTMSLSEEPNLGNVYVFDNNSVEKKIENVSISNGIAWSKDHKTLYFIDTPTLEVVSYSYEKKSNKIADRRTIITIPKEDGFPDGMTIDADGMLWIAHWGGWQVTRWNPKTGKKLHSIKFPAARITSLTFGGKDLTDLFITSARIGLSKEELDEQPLAGSLFIIRNSGYKGMLAYEFNN